MIIKLFILIVIFFVIIITLRKQENFTTNKPLLETPNPILNNNNYGIHSIVNPNNYNLKYFGPTCLNTCISEHVQKVNWESANEKEDFAKENILQYNRENPGENFCHLAHKKSSDNSIRDCSGNDCKDSCGSDTYLHCRVNDDGVGKKFCVEKNINYLSGGAVLNKTKCGGNKNNCINRYWDNISEIKRIYDNYISKNSSD